MCIFVVCYHNERRDSTWHFFLQVSSAPPPTIPKQPLLPAIEAPPMASVPMLEYSSPSSSPSHSFASESQCSGGMEEEEEGREEEEEESCKVVDDQEGVFMTQVCTDTVSALHSYHSVNAGLIQGYFYRLLT